MPTEAAPLSQEKFKHPGRLVQVVFGYLIRIINTAANPLDSFVGEYDADEQKVAGKPENEDTVNENHVAQFMQVSIVNTLSKL